MMSRTGTWSLGIDLSPTVSTVGDWHWKSRNSAVGKIVKIQSVRDRV